jgi:hypothetical protein
VGCGERCGQLPRACGRRFCLFFANFGNVGTNLPTNHHLYTINIVEIAGSKVPHDDDVLVIHHNELSQRCC